MTSTWKPTEWKADFDLISFDLIKMQADFVSFINQAGDLLGEPIGTIRWYIVEPEGRHEGRGPPSDITKPFSALSDRSLTISIMLDCLKYTERPTLKWPEVEIKWHLHLARRKLSVEITVPSRQTASEIFNFLSAGVKIMPIELPTHHRYISSFLERFFLDHPNYERNIFLIMRFSEADTHRNIERSIRTVAERYDMNVLRADQRSYTDDLWDNVLTYMYGCGYGVAVFEQINIREFNPNVAIEVGFMRAINKSPLLLKDQAIHQLPTDIVGTIYRPFNTYDIDGTIPPQMVKWFYDLGIKAGEQV